MTNFRAVALALFCLASPAWGQVNNPGTPTSGTPANNDCAKFVVSGGNVQSITSAGAGCAAPFTPAALTKADDTNVTLTLGGTPATALLQTVSITAGWSGQLALSRLARGTDGQLIVGQTSADPVYKTVTGDWTLSAAGAATLATVNSNVGSFGSATQCVALTVNGKGLITAASAATCAPAASSITGGAALTRTNDTNVTVTLGGTPGTSLLAATSLTLGWSGNLSIARGGTGAGTQQAAFDALAPTATVAGSIAYWDGTHWVKLDGNASGTKVLQETSAGVPSWTIAGTGTVVSVTCGSNTITITGTCTYPYIYANLSANQTGVTTSVLTKVAFNTVNGTASAQMTGGTFTPTLAGVYAVNVTVSCDGTTLSGLCIAAIYRNGANYANVLLPANTSGGSSTVTAMVSANGTTDTIEGYGRVTCAANCSFDGGTAPLYTFMSAHYISP